MERVSRLRIDDEKPSLVRQRALIGRLADTERKEPGSRCQALQIMAAVFDFALITHNTLDVLEYDAPGVLIAE